MTNHGMLLSMRRPLPLLIPFVFGCTEMPPIGHVWSVDTTTATWHEPEGAQALVQNMASSYPFFVGAWENKGNKATLMLAIADGEAQDFCSRTVFMPEIKMARDRTFSFGPEDYTIANGFTIEDFEMTGAFSESFDDINDMAFLGNLNMASAPADMLLGGGDQSACELAASFSIYCTDCRDGSAECLQARATGTVATLAADIKLVEITEADCHEQCTASGENPDCEL